MGAVGRPRKYKSNKRLSAEIEKYFNSCFGIKYKKIRKKKYKDLTDKEIPPDGYCYYPEVDENGKQVIEQKKPFSITGMCLYLGIVRDTLCEYEKLPQFSDTIKNAKTRIEQWVEEQSIIGALNPTVAMFNLSNNFNWKSRSEIDNKVSGSLKLEDVLK